MTYQQLWCFVHWPDRGWSDEDAKERFDAHWNASHHVDTAREVRDHWKKVLQVIRAVLRETER